MLLFSISNCRSLRLIPAYPDFSCLCRMILGPGRRRIGWQFLPSGLVTRISPQNELEDGTTAAVPNENKRNPRVSLRGDNPTFKENLGILRTPLPSQLRAGTHGYLTPIWWRAARVSWSGNRRPSCPPDRTRVTSLRQKRPNTDKLPRGQLADSQGLRLVRSAIFGFCESADVSARPQHQSVALGRNSSLTFIYE